MHHIHENNILKPIPPALGANADMSMLMIMAREIIIFQLMVLLIYISSIINNIILDGEYHRKEFWSFHSVFTIQPMIQD